MNKIFKNMYLIAAGIFLIISGLSYFLADVKSFASLLAGATISLLCVVFNFLYKPKWSTENRNLLLESFKSLEVFGKTLPFSFLGNLQMIWIVLIAINFFNPVIASFVPKFPVVILVVLSSIAFALFILGSFYNLLQGKYKTLILTAKIFALLQIVDVVMTFISSNVVSISKMCLFLTFWTLGYFLQYILSEVDPKILLNEEKALAEKNKKEKEKKEKSKKQASKKETKTEVKKDTIEE